MTTLSNEAQFQEAEPTDNLPPGGLPGLTLEAADVGVGRASVLVFEGAKSKALLRRIEQVAPSAATVLIYGETGTGKEIAARRVHQLSQRSERPFVAVNCGALTESLMESQLFGHERGAFTGATCAKAGWFEAAHGGTLFLDEIGELSLCSQVKLLRVLQEREVVRVGSQQSVPVDVRLIAATNVALEAAVVAGRFRADLYYRLNVASLSVPSLRERQCDILPLAQRFLRLFSEQLQVACVTLDSSAELALLEHPGRGNIRELENVIHNALLVCNGRQVTAVDLRLTTFPSSPPAPAASDSPDLVGEDLFAKAVHACLELGRPDLYKYLEQRIITLAHEYCGGNQLQTSRLLGLSRNVVRARLIEAGKVGGSVRSLPSEPVTGN